jgi:hypothetical protein
MPKRKYTRVARVKGRIRYYLWEDGRQWVFREGSQIGHLYRSCRVFSRDDRWYCIPNIIVVGYNWSSWIEKGAPLRTRLGCIVFREEMKEPEAG